MSPARVLLAALLALSCLTAGCRTLPADPERIPSHRLPPALEGPAAEAARRFAELQGPEASGFLPLKHGHEGLDWRMALIETARVSIDAQYYQWSEDAVGSLMEQKLIEAAGRGVRVRVLVDDFTLDDKDEVVAILSRIPNLEVRLFNPFATRAAPPLWRELQALSQLNDVNQRMHNKQFLVDNRIGILGGRNMSDEYFGWNEDYNFIDMEVVAAGPVVQEMSRRFDEYWNSDIVYPGAALIDDVDEGDVEDAREDLDERLEKNAAVTARLRQPPARWGELLASLPERLVPGAARVLFEAASGERSNQVALGLKPLAGEVREDVTMMMAYLFPDEPMLDWFREMVGRGVRVRALTNSAATYDSDAGARFYDARRRDLLEAGVELYELRPDAADRSFGETAPVTGEFIALHAKTIVFDRDRLFVGSFNFEPRAHLYNREDGLLIEAPPLATDLRRHIEGLMEPRNCWRVILDERGAMRWLSFDGEAVSPPSRGFVPLRTALLGLVPERFR